VERGNVLERDEDVPVELDVGDVLHVAVRGERPLLVLAAEERELDLLTLVLVRVVLDVTERSRLRSASVSAFSGSVVPGSGAKRPTR
jgi:hypothetical protein